MMNNPLEISVGKPPENLQKIVDLLQSLAETMLDQPAVKHKDSKGALVAATILVLVNAHIPGSSVAWDYLYKWRNENLCKFKQHPGIEITNQHLRAAIEGTQSLSTECLLTSLEALGHITPEQRKSAEEMKEEHARRKTQANISR